LFYDGLRGPKFWQLDSTLVKYFKVTERIKFDCAWSFTTRPTYSFPTIRYRPQRHDGTEHLGRDGNYGREIQFNGRIHF
jgi:hypothetical protein